MARGSRGWTRGGRPRNDEIFCQAEELVFFSSSLAADGWSCDRKEWRPSAPAVVVYDNGRGNAWADIACGGGGPENVFVVANPLSQDSLTIANHYCHLRRIHSVNVFHLPWAGSRETIDIETFRTAILQPILARNRTPHSWNGRSTTSSIPVVFLTRSIISGDLRRPAPQNRPRGEVGRHGGVAHRTDLPAPRVRSRDTSYVFSFDNRRATSITGLQLVVFAARMAGHGRGSGSRARRIVLLVRDAGLHGWTRQLGG